MKKILIVVGLLLCIIKVQACPTFYFHITFAGTQTFYIENMSNPSDNLTATGNGSIDAWDFSSTLSNPCGLKFAANTCYKISNIAATTGAQAIAIKFSGNPNGLSIDYSVSAQTFTVINSGIPSAYSLTWGNVTNNPPACSVCNSDILIYDNYLNYDNVNGSYPPPAVIPTSFSTPLTQSGTYIIIGTSTIPSGADVRLDADPVNGYIYLEVGFETQPGATFVAEALDGCGSGIPTRHSQSITRLTQSHAGKSQQELKNHDDAIKVYPNPTKGRITVQHKNPIKLLQVYNANGLLLQTIREANTTASEIDLSKYSSGIYLMRADGKMAGKVMKQ